MAGSDPIDDLAEALKRLRVALSVAAAPNLSELLRSIQLVRAASKHFSLMAAEAEEVVHVPEDRGWPALTTLHRVYSPFPYPFEVTAVRVRLNPSGLFFEALMGRDDLAWKEVHQYPTLIVEYADLYAKAVEGIARRIRGLSDRVERVINQLASCLREASREFGPEIMAEILRETAERSTH